MPCAQILLFRGSVCMRWSKELSMSFRRVYLSTIVTVIKSGRHIKKQGSQRKLVDIATKKLSQRRPITRAMSATVKMRFKACSSQKIVSPIPT